MTLAEGDLKAGFVYRTEYQLFGKCDGSRTCMVQTFGRAGTNLGRNGLR